METTNEGILLKEKKSKFMAIALELAEEIGENEVTITRYPETISGYIRTRKDIRLQKVKEIVGDISTTITVDEDFLEIRMGAEL